jgi:hypothetical protein
MIFIGRKEQKPIKLQRSTHADSANQRQEPYASTKFHFYSHRAVDKSVDEGGKRTA